MNFCLYLFLMAWPFEILAGSPVRVTVDGGVLVGVSDGGIDSFKGIPYAQPPTGPRRWRPPQPVQPWPGERSATAFGAACPQAGPSRTADEAPLTTSEDCLTLNIWTPSQHDHPLPVMVWVHGGGNSNGASSKPYYDGRSFARDGVVLVSLNYRLGALGFFALPELTKEAGPRVPVGNYGLMDQLAALVWVRKNIGAFGGDPKNITLFGESAGGEDVLCLMAAPSAAGLFSRAIVESGGEGCWNLPTLAQAEHAGEKTVAGSGAGASLEKLRSLPAEALVKAEPGGDGPIADGRLIRQDPKAAFAKGEIAHIPLMIGSNSDEGSLGFPASILSGFSAAELQTARSLYGNSLDDAALARQLIRDLLFTGPARWIARKRAEAGVPVYLYRFSYVRTRHRGDSPGAGHGSEIPYVFDTWFQAPYGGAFLSSDDRAEARTLHTYWVNFAKTGVPQCPNAPAWPAYTTAKDQLLEFGTETTVRQGLDKARLDFFDAHALSKDNSL